MNKKTRSRLLVSFAITFSLAGLFLLSVRSRMYQVLELKSLDLRFVLQGSRRSPAPVVHIDIDDQSLAAVGRWPWPRRYHALLTDILKECQARMVLWDVIFTEEFKDNPGDDALFAEAMSGSGATYLPFYFVEDREQAPVALKQLLVKDISLTDDKAAQLLRVSAESLRDTLPKAKKLFFDETVREFMRQDPSITFDGLLQAMETRYGWFLFPEDENYVQELYNHHDLSRLFMQSFSAGEATAQWPFSRKYRDMNVPIRPYVAAIKGSGFINAEPDIDGVTRKVPLLVRYGNKLLPQLTIAALRDALDAGGVEAAPGRITLTQAEADGARKDIVIPVDNDGCMLINWVGKWGASFNHVPYYLILKLQEIRGQLKERQTNVDHAEIDGVALEYLKKNETELMRRLTGMVKGKICIVGLTATGTHDLRPVPLQENYPMVGIHSNIISTILSERFIVKKEGAIRLLIFLLAALVIGMSAFLKMWKGLVLSIGFATGYFFVSCGLFSRLGIWVDMVGPMGISLLGFAAITSFRFFTEEKDKLWIKSAFSHYLSQEVIGELLDDPSKLKLGGERREITVFFSDIRGFTTYSESHQPEEVVAMLNELLSAQVNVVFKYSGTLDKFVGDELMCFFGAPGNRHLKDHALVAVKTAVEIQATMRRLQEKWSSEKKSVLTIGIGINSGDMVVGNMGSATRMDYTVIGDNVNLGARLCSAAGGGDIIVSGATYEKVSDLVIAEKLEPIVVKGKAKPVSVYRIVGLK